MLSGMLVPTTLKPAPVTESPVIVAVVLPELAIVTFVVADRPTQTRPKVTLVGVEESCVPACAKGETLAASPLRSVAARKWMKREVRWLKRKPKKGTGRPWYLMTFLVFGNVGARSTELPPLSGPVARSIDSSDAPVDL